MSGKRIVLTCFGTHGDINPYIAIALELQARGHQPVIATTEFHRRKIAAQGIAFHAVRPDLWGLQNGDEEFMARVMGRHWGAEFLFREIVLAHLRETYADTVEAIRGADLVVTHLLSLAAFLAVRKLRLPWVSTVLAPLSLFSTHDPCVYASLPYGDRIARMGRRVNAGLLWFFQRFSKPWLTPYRELEKELGLSPGPNPIFAGQYSPQCVLALFSSALAKPQPDWPKPTCVTGFPFHDRDAQGDGMPEELRRFLGEGPAPVVFTLGSAAVHLPGDFFYESVEAVARLGCRAVFVAAGQAQQLNRELPEGSIAVEYAPFSELFPRAAVVVHQGGVGTTGQALRAGRPMLVAAQCHDQFDNGHRVARLGAGITMPRSRYNARTASAALQRLLKEKSFYLAAAEFGAQVRAENGARAACDAIEQVLGANIA